MLTVSQDKVKTFAATHNIRIEVVGGITTLTTQGSGSRLPRRIRWLGKLHLDTKELTLPYVFGDDILKRRLLNSVLTQEFLP